MERLAQKIQQKMGATTTSANSKAPKPPPIHFGRIPKPDAVDRGRLSIPDKHTPNKIHSLN